MFPKIGVPQIIHFNRVFHCKPSILVVFPLFLETPICFTIIAVILWILQDVLTLQELVLAHDDNMAP